MGEEWKVQGTASLLPSPPSPGAKTSASASLRIVSLDESDPFPDNPNTSVASFRHLTGTSPAWAFFAQTWAQNLQNNGHPFEFLYV